MLNQNNFINLPKPKTNFINRKIDKNVVLHSNTYI